jgi:hypothetical protein
VIGGGVVMAVLMILILPVAVMLGGAIWSALMGWLLVDDVGPARGRASDAVFASVAAATWNAVSDADGARPEVFPALGTRAARALRR